MRFFIYFKMISQKNDPWFYSHYFVNSLYGRFGMDDFTELILFINDYFSDFENKYVIIFWTQAFRRL